MVAMLATPSVLWIIGLYQVALLTGIAMAPCVPSMTCVVYMAIKYHTWPTITRGPRFMQAGKIFPYRYS